MDNYKRAIKEHKKKINELKEKQNEVVTTLEHTAATVEGKERKAGPQILINIDVRILSTIVVRSKCSSCASRDLEPKSRTYASGFKRQGGAFGARKRI